MREHTRRRMQALGLRVLTGGDSHGHLQDAQVTHVAIEHRGGEIFITVGVSAGWCGQHASEITTVALNDRRFTGWRVGDSELSLTLDWRLKNYRMRQLVKELFDEYARVEHLLRASGERRCITVAINGHESLVPLWSHAWGASYVW